MARSKNRRRFRSASEIQRILGDLESSGLTQRAFAKSRGIPISTLSLWLRKERAKSSSPPLIPVQVRPGGVQSLPFEVLLGGGQLVRIPAGFDPEALRLLLQTLESC